MHVPIHVVDAPKIDENEDSEVFEFTCALPYETKYPEESSLVKTVQTTIIQQLVERKGCDVQI